jgi:hypothetical protein
MDKFRDLPIPATEHQNNIKEGNRDVLDSWMEEFTFANRLSKTVEKEPIDIFNIFQIGKTSIILNMKLINRN